VEKLNRIFHLLFALAMGAATIWSFRIPPAMGFQEPELAKIFIWHFPCPMIAVTMLAINAWASLMFLRTQDRIWDERAVASQELAYMFSILTMATGMLFSKIQWGAWWQWDPRQTSFLLVLMIYGAYFVMRGAFPDAERRASNTAAFSLAAILPAMFLIFVFPRLPQVVSFHPSDSIMKGKIKGEYGYAVVTVMALLAFLTAWLYRLRVRVGLLELNKEKSNEGLDIRGGNPAPTGVVRRLSVPGKN
jgi:heme exporter protein C